MKSLFSILFSLTLAPAVFAQEMVAYNFESLQQKLEEESRDQVVVVNFWATWCKPCIQELPYFEALPTEMEGEKLKVLLVSLDMEKKKAVTYRERKGLRSEVVYLDETDFNQWIDSISPRWSGAIPATLLLGPDGQRQFHEGAFSQKELNSFVEHFIEKIG
jgi:thiol-disulfide isomerase/thioredoxin